MQLAIKLAISVAVILAATGVARKFPSIAGLISVMPLAGALILAFVYYENKGDWQVMQGFTRGEIPDYQVAAWATGSAGGGRQCGGWRRD